MNISKQTQHCKAVTRGQLEGDRMVAMVALNRTGVKVPEPVIKGIRQNNTTNELRMRDAYDVYHIYASFIERDRHDKYHDAELYVHKLVNSVNSFNGSSVCEVVIKESSWVFKVANKEYTYTAGRYNATRAAELYNFLACACVDSDMLIRVYTELAKFQ